MVDTTIFNKLSLIFNFIKDNSFTFLILLLVLIMLIDLIYGNNKKETKILYILSILLILIYGCFEYYKPLVNIIDVYITNIFRITYFPSIIEYFSMIIITIIIQLISIKKYNIVHKNINLWVGIVIELLFVINVIAMENITVDLNTVTNIYEQDLLLSIFQLTSIIFMIWIVVNFIIFIIKLFLTNKIEMPKLSSDYE